MIRQRAQLSVASASGRSERYDDAATVVSVARKARATLAQESPMALLRVRPRHMPEGLGARNGGLRGIRMAVRQGAGERAARAGTGSLG